MADEQNIFADPEFRKLSGVDKIAVLDQLDPDFAKLPLNKKPGVIFDAINNVPMDAKNKGLFYQAGQFVKTLGKDVVGAAGGAMRLSPPGMALDILRGKPTVAEEIGGAQAEQFRKAGEAAKEGRYSEAFGHGLAGAVPLVGPLAAETGEEIGEGEYGRAAAHGLELSLPYTGRPLARGTTAVARGGGRLVQGGAGAASDFASLPVIRNVPFVRNIRGILGDIAGRNPGMSPQELAQGLYKEVNGRAPRTAGEKIEAVRMYREAVKPPKPPKPEKPLKPPEPKAPEPFKPSAATARKMKFGGRTEPEFRTGAKPSVRRGINRAMMPEKAAEEAGGETTVQGKAEAEAEPHARSGVLESRGAAKRNYLAARFEDLGLTPEQIERMSDAELEKHVLEEGEALKSRGAIKSGFRKYDPANPANTPYNIMRLEIAKAMRVRAAARAAGSVQ